MSGVNHTTEERDAIRRAYNELGGLAGRFDTRAAHELREALKEERRERSGIDVARALLVESAAHGPRDRAADLYGYTDGCRRAAMLGAALYRSLGSRYRRWRRQRAQPAIEAHRTAVLRALDSLGDE